MGKVIAVVIVLAVPTAGLYWLRSRWQLETVRAVAFEIVARALPGPARNVAGLRRTLARRVTAVAVAMPSGKVRVPAAIELRLAPEDYDTLDAVLGCVAIEGDLEAMLRDRARRERWDLPNHGPTITLMPDQVLHPGWIPSARVSATPHVTYASNDAGPTAAHRTDRTQARTVFEGEGRTVVLPEPAGARLVLVDPDGEALEFCTDHVSIGRASTSHLYVDDERASRRHAEMRRDERGWTVADLGSTNGTYVDSHRVDGHPMRVQVGNAIHIGEDGPAFTVRSVGPAKPAGW
ncbi:FhaA domain-containing protein [Pengzhenrongella phosphoraccumulans]|uniref:FhaA domain-containing protein n=1 Tax=Pengzhenrongella phosphoraccumulans TaxID=3114394 RepID=UPI003890957B